MHSFTGDEILASGAKVPGVLGGGPRVGCPSRSAQRIDASSAQHHSCPSTL